METHRSTILLKAELERHRVLVQATGLHYAKSFRESIDDLTQEGWIGFLRPYQAS